ELVEKKVISFRQKDVAYMAWRNSSEGLAQRWWRDALLASEEIARLYQ
ncbi:LysR family transcriptional regulator, partial [Citrobacter sp. TBCS-14]